MQEIFFIKGLSRKTQLGSVARGMKCFYTVLLEIMPYIQLIPSFLLVLKDTAGECCKGDEVSIYCPFGDNPIYTTNAVLFISVERHSWGVLQRG